MHDQFNLEPFVARREWTVDGIPVLTAELSLPDVYKRQRPATPQGKAVDHRKRRSRVEKIFFLIFFNSTYFLLFVQFGVKMTGYCKVHAVITPKKCL